eukprot:Awhi_evm1s4768
MGKRRKGGHHQQGQNKKAKLSVSLKKFQQKEGLGKAQGLSEAPKNSADKRKQKQNIIKLHGRNHRALYAPY